MAEEEAPKLLGPAEIRALATANDIVPTKKLGQNFLHDAGTIRKIVAKADISPGEVVLEVGPGLGSLTLGLLEAGARVEAVEVDRGLARALPATVAQRSAEWAARLRLTNKDATLLRAGDLEQEPSALVANLPYNVAVPILLTTLAELPSITKALVMVQKEVADRLVAPKGSKTYGAPTVKLAWYGVARRAGTIGPNVFWPKPNIDSALVKVAVEKPERGDRALREATFALIDTAFEQRRKMLRASLRACFPNQADLSRVLTEAGVDPQARPESLEIQDFIRLGEGWLSL